MFLSNEMISATLVMSKIIYRIFKEGNVGNNYTEISILVAKLRFITKYFILKFTTASR